MPKAKHTAELAARATALTEDFSLAGESDDVLDGEEITFVAQLGDQPQLLVDLPAHLRFSRPVGQRR